MKKVLSWLLVAVMLICMLPTTVFAGEKLTVSAKTVTAVENTEGTEVLVPLNLKNNTGLGAIIVKVQFDKDALKMTKVVDHELLQYYDVDKEKNVPFTYTGFSQSNNGEQVNATGEVSLMWYATSSSNANGKLATMEFQVKAGASAGQKNIAVAITSLTVGGSTASSDTYTTENGSVTLVNPTVPATGVTLSKNELSLDLKNNKTGTLTATVAPENSTDTVTWTSSDESVATVANGVVTAVAVGTATITAKAGDVRATCTVTVVNCDHSYTKADTTKDGACKTPGTCMTEAVYYYSCEYCGMVEKNDSHTFKGEKDLSNHSYTVKDTTKEGTLMTAGTCTTEAVYYFSCACGAVEKSADHTFTGAKDLNNHSYTAQTQKAEAVMTPGNCTTETVYYYSCSRCGDVEKDADHTFKGAVDDTKHDYTKQTENTSTCYKLGTCTAEAEYYYSCLRCDAVEANVNHTFKGDKDPNNHAGTTKTIKYDANQHWWFCEGCENETGAKANHSSTGSNVATCTEKAKCDVCNQSYGDLKPHSVTKVDAKAATCTEAGNSEYWTCSSCRKLFSDAEGNNETTLANVTVEKLGHNLTKTPAKAATCTTDGTLAYWSCSNACCNGIEFADEEGTTKLDSIVDPAKGHNYGALIAEVPSTCTVKGTAAHYYCEACNTYFDANKVETTKDKLVLPLAEHTFDKYVTEVEGSETKIGVDQCLCSVCDAEGEYTAYLKLPATLHIVKGANSTSNPPVGVEFAFVVGSGDRTFPVTTGAATEDLVNEQSIGVGGKTKEEAINGLKKLLMENEWTVKQTTASGNGWTVDATEYTVTFVVKDDNTVKVNITAPVTVTVTEKNEDGSEKTYTKTEVQEFDKIEFTNTYVNTTPARPSHRPSGGNGATSSDKVQSSKTFDAGIAAYVGLSVLSLTGSALVIGKKKEF